MNPVVDNQISVDHVATYLASRKWKRIEAPDYTFRWSGPKDDNGKTIVLFLPADEDAPEFEESLGVLLNALRVIEGRPVDEITTDIVGA